MSRSHRICPACQLTCSRTHASAALARRHRSTLGLPPLRPPPPRRSPRGSYRRAEAGRTQREPAAARMMQDAAGCGCACACAGRRRTGTGGAEACGRRIGRLLVVWAAARSRVAAQRAVAGRADVKAMPGRQCMRAAVRCRAGIGVASRRGRGCACSAWCCTSAMSSDKYSIHYMSACT